MTLMSTLKSITETLMEPAQRKKRTIR